MSQASLEQASYIVKDDLKVDLPASVFKVLGLEVHTTTSSSRRAGD